MAEPRAPQIPTLLIVKAITKLQIDLTRIVPVKSVEGLAIVELHATVGDVTVALLLGHKDLRMAARYQHLSLPS
jgi:hypothetical protein